MNEATARIRINNLLEKAGWRFFQEGDKPANIRLEPGVAIKRGDLEGLGADFENAGNGRVDFLLLDSRGFPLLVLEARSSDKNPLGGKEQASSPRGDQSWLLYRRLPRRSATIPQAGQGIR